MEPQRRQRETTDLSDTAAASTDDSRQASRKKSRSEIWLHWTQSRNSENEKIVKCNYCDTSYTNVSGTSNLWRHYNNTHKYSRFSQTTLSSGGTLSHPTPLSVEENESVTKLLMAAIIDASLALSFVENSFFSKFVAKLNPRYKIPSRRVLTSRIKSEYHMELDSMKPYLQESICGKVSLTTDAWSSRIFRSYMAITTHWIDVDWNLKSTLLNFVRFPAPHDGISVKNILVDELECWGLSQKLMAVTTDNGSEMLLGTELLQKKLGTSEIHVRCMAHVVNLAVKVSFEMIKKDVCKVRKLIVAIRKSVNRRERFDELKASMGYSDVLLPGIDVENRWSSTYYMLLRALKARPILAALVHEDLKLSVHSISDTEWTLVQSLCDLLKTFAKVTDNQSGKHYVTLSTSQRVFEMLLKTVHDFTEMQFGTLNTTGNSMRAKLKEYENLISTDLTKIANILDPRFSNTDAESETFLRDYMLLNNYQVGIATGQTQESNNFLSDIFGSDSNTGPSQSNTDEIGLFFNATRVREHSEIDPLGWWKINEKRFPNVAILARDVLAIQASSVSSESTFSTSGNLVSDARSRLSDEVITAVMCLREWQRLRNAS